VSRIVLRAVRSARCEALADRAGPPLRQQAHLGKVCSAKGRAVARVGSLIRAVRIRTSRSRSSTASGSRVLTRTRSATSNRSTPSLSARRASATASMRSVPAAATTIGAALARHQPARDPDDALATEEQEPLQRTGDMAPPVLERQIRSAPRPVAQSSAAANPRHQGWSAASNSPLLAAAAGSVCERIVHVRAGTIMALSGPFHRI